ncbi:MAG: hypothetical protein ACR2J8_11220, partial [Thermomicrobiales bacterium]
MGRRRSVFAVLGIVALLLPAGLAPAASAQNAGNWVSPTYGFMVNWDPNVWEEEPSDALTGEG